MPLPAYRDPIVAFARSVHDAYFANGAKIVDDVDERAFYDDFWTEYNDLLTRHGANGRLVGT